MNILPLLGNHTLEYLYNIAEMDGYIDAFSGWCECPFEQGSLFAMAWASGYDRAIHDILRGWL